MLILTRRIGEKLIIGEDGDRQIEVVILDVKGQQVKLGITADKEVPVHREEIYRRIQRERLATLRSETDLYDAPKFDGG